MITLGFGGSGYVTQGGDLGSPISQNLGQKYKECKGMTRVTDQPDCPIPNVVKRFMVCSDAALVGVMLIDMITKSMRSSEHRLIPLQSSQRPKRLG